ncbi:MAG TPA: single-stranded DNA-binding protein [Actinomycetales bacterium]|nr:single-stranded DNA-binding protein [Actinomycetales bacterium]
MRGVFVTVVGNVGADPVARDTAGGRVVTFNLGVSERYFDRSKDQWADRPTTWYRISCWNPQLGRNIGECVRRGERVMVTGRLRFGTYQDKDGVERASLEVVAEHVGHEMSFGLSRYTKMERKQAQDGADGGQERSELDDFAEDLDDVPGVDLDTGELLDEERVPV